MASFSTSASSCLAFYPKSATILIASSLSNCQVLLEDKCFVGQQTSDPLISLALWYLRNATYFSGMARSRWFALASINLRSDPLLGGFVGNGID